MGTRLWAARRPLQPATIPNTRTTQAAQIAGTVSETYGGLRGMSGWKTLVYGNLTEMLQPKCLP